MKTAEQRKIEKLEEYIKLLIMELDEVCVLADVHGWKSKRVEQGEKLRKELADIETEVTEDEVKEEWEKLKKVVSDKYKEPALDKEIEQDNGVKSLREIAMNMWNNLTLSDKIDLMGNFEEYVGRKPSTLTGREIEILFFGKREIEQGEKCPDCEGTGKDGHDRCDPPNWYICEKCNGTGKVAIKPTKAEADSDKRKSVKEFCKAYINPRLDKNYDVHLTGEELFNLLLEFSQQREVTDDDIKTEMDNYFNKLQRNPLPDIERFRIEMAFEYAAKWAREQMKNR